MPADEAAGATVVRRLTSRDLDVLVELRLRALRTNPLSFGSSPEDDRMGRAETARSVLDAGGEHVVFGAFDGGELAGMAGIARSEKLKGRHHANIWGMFVAPESRRSGLGAALLAACVELARAWPGVLQVNLSVSATAPAARRLYERAGFRHWGTERRALICEGVEADEHYLVLALDA